MSEEKRTPEEISDPYTNLIAKVAKISEKTGIPITVAYDALMLMLDAGNEGASDEETVHLFEEYVAPYRKNRKQEAAND